jgi:6-phosphogluconate dehydrogenase
MKKTIGIIGLGKMGENIALNLSGKGYNVAVYNRHEEQTRKISKHRNIIASFDYDEFVSNIPKPRTIILMVTAGKPVDNVIGELSRKLNKGDIVIDGGNSFYEDSIRRYNELKKKGVHFLDVGVSGGIYGARHGTCLMIGGEKEVFRKTEQLFKDLSVKRGYGYLGKSGAGHFTKMIHNGIEYALIESYAEGYEILNKSKYKFDFEKISKLWSNGSIIRSYITELAGNVFKKCNNNLDCVVGKIGGGETGSWALKTAKKEKVDSQVLEHALKKRKTSLKKQSFSTKFVSSIRKEFGGHNEP